MRQSAAMCAELRLLVSHELKMVLISTASSTSHPRTLVVTPTYNERDNLPFFVAAVRRSAPHADILVVDDNSPDGTGAVADAIATTDTHVRVMHRPEKRGLGTAYLEAFAKGLAEGYERFFEMDADLSHDPRYLPAFESAFDKGGSLYSRTILGLDVRDLTSGFKGFTRRALEAVELSKVQSNGYSFQIEMTYRALRKGIHVAEVPIVFVDRRAGKSKMSQRVFVEAVGMVWRLRAKAARGEL
jgi:dolichol-phosphate mannosyltransferase